MYINVYIIGAGAKIDPVNEFGQTPLVYYNTIK
jgi:hypothetical protein